VRSRYEQQIRLAAAQEERNRLARELHDSIKQQVFAIQAAAATAETRLGTDRDGARDALSMVRASSREAMAELEAVTDQLRAAPLENAGLVEALRKQAEALGFRTGAHVDVTIGRLPPNASLGPGTQQAIFRVAQEALANVARHARAARVKVSLEFTADELVLRVVDDGVGFDASRGVGGSGINNMRSRAAELGGSVDITAAASGGTSVRLTVPVTFNSPKVYLRKAFISAAVLAFVGIVVPLTSHEQDSRGWLHWSVLTILSLESIRYARAWIRARRLAVNSA
jgi:signal transduction histidine kinase